MEDIEHKLVRAALAMANTEDGGCIAVGVSQTGDTWDPNGITDAVWATYPRPQNLDQILSTVGYPPIDVDVSEVADEGRRFLGQMFVRQPCL